MILVDTSVWVDHLRRGDSVLAGLIGYVDAHLLAAVRLTPGASLWTPDKRLQTAAAHLNVAALPPVVR